jgi:hypothetical protein
LGLTFEHFFGIAKFAKFVQMHGRRGQAAFVTSVEA